MSIPTLTTKRLLLRAWQSSDLEPFARMNAQPETMRYIGDGKPRTRQQSDENIQYFKNHWAEFGFGLFAVQSRDTNKFLGFVGLSVPNDMPEILPAVEIGWRLSEESRGKGLATEGALRVLEFGFEHLHLDRMVSICDQDNLASERVMQKIGMKYWRDGEVPSSNRQVKIYETQQRSSKAI